MREMDKLICIMAAILCHSDLNHKDDPSIQHDHLIQSIYKANALLKIYQEMTGEELDKGSTQYC